MGIYYWKQMQPGYIDQAMNEYKKALEMDASFFPAWSSLAATYGFKAFNNQMLPAQAAQCCKDSLDEAIRLTPDHSRTHTARGLYNMFFTWDWKLAAKHFADAINYQDSDQFFFQATVFYVAGMYLVSNRRFDEGIAMYKKALKMDPLNLEIQLELARAYLYQRNFSKAIETIEAILRTKPDLIQAREALGWIRFHMGQQREGIEAFEEAHNRSSLTITGMAGLAYAYARTSQTTLAKSTLELLVSYYQDLPMYLPYYSLALAHLGALEYKEMFVHLNNAVEARMPILIYLDANPIWDEIKRFTAYQELHKKIFGTDQRPPL